MVLALIPPPSPAAISRFAESDAAAFDSSEAPAFNTSAQAVPSGYFNSPCCCTISARRSGIIMKMPSKPPSTATRSTRVTSRSKPRIMIAGMVTPTPKAIDSPAEPAVCEMLFSRIVASLIPKTWRKRKKVMLMTATGIEALTVKPTFNTKYSDDAPKMTPRIVPKTTLLIVSSRRLVSGAMYGSNAGASSRGSGAASLAMSGVYHRTLCLTISFVQQQAHAGVVETARQQKSGEPRVDVDGVEEARLAADDVRAL